MSSIIICPWCGTNYIEFQSNCRNCGGTMPAPAAQRPVAAGGRPALSMPPSPPRQVAPNYVWRLLAQDGWVISMTVFVLLGIIFTMVGGGLILGIITAFVGFPFVGLGLLFLGGGVAVVYWRYQVASRTVEVLKSGLAQEGTVTSLEPNYNVRINGRMPWTIRYEFTLDGQHYSGSTSTLNNPQVTYAPGPAIVLYLPEDPQVNQLYPHP